MSMNLYCKLQGEKIDLYQTPTYVTWMCLATKKGRAISLSGSKAKRAMNCYIEWAAYRVTELWLDNIIGEGEKNRSLRDIQSLALSVESASEIEVYTV